MALPGMPPASGTGGPDLGVLVPVMSVDRYQPPMRPSTGMTSALPSSKSSIKSGIPVEAAFVMHVPPSGPVPPVPVPAVPVLVPAVPVLVPAVPVVVVPPVPVVVLPAVPVVVLPAIGAPVPPVLVEPATLPSEPPIETGLVPAGMESSLAAQPYEANRQRAMGSAIWRMAGPPVDPLRVAHRL